MDEFNTKANQEIGERFAKSLAEEFGLNAVCFKCGKPPAVGDIWRKETVADSVIVGHAKCFPKRERCADLMRATPHSNLPRDVRKKLGLHAVRCELPVGHDGNHRAWTKTAKYEWWNQEKNPQRLP